VSSAPPFDGPDHVSKKFYIKPPEENVIKSQLLYPFLQYYAGLLNSFQKTLASNYHADGNETYPRALAFPQQLVPENAQTCAWCCQTNIGFIYNLPYSVDVGRESS
jgi:hypothetical protein